MGGVFRRFYLVRPLSTLLLCLPGIVISLWYAWQAYSTFDRYRRTVEADISLSIEDFQLHLYDALKRDIRWITMPSVPDDSKIATLSFHMSSKKLAKLYSGMGKDTNRPYVTARLISGKERHKVEMRLRGHQHWHHIGRKKSFKVKLPKGKLFQGHRIFNLINHPTPVVIGEKLILDIARKHQLLTPRNAFVRVIVNDTDLGVYHFQNQPDESLLRTRHMMPGSIFSGNLTGKTKTEALWNNSKKWKKSASRTTAEKESFTELDRLLSMVKNATAKEFADFARLEIDLESFATYDAIDVIFGGEQHGFRENHKLYFDPYKGRWFPIGWNFGGFKHDPYFNIVENPILLRLKMVPEYLKIRNHKLYHMLTGHCSVSSIKAKGRKMLRKIAPQLASDKYFDAYKLLPRVDKFHRQMTRPMSLKRAALVFESEMATFEKRHNFLMTELKKNPLWIRQHDPQQIGPQQGIAPMGEVTVSNTVSKPAPVGMVTEPADTDAKPATAAPTISNLDFPKKYKTRFDLIIHGRAAAQPQSIEVKWSNDCPEPRWQVFEGKTPFTQPSDTTLAPVIQATDLNPKVGFEKYNPNDNRLKNIRVQMVPAVYPFLIQSNCVPKQIHATAKHLVMGSQIRSRTATKTILATLVDDTFSIHDKPIIKPGQVAPMSPKLRPPAPEAITLGPGLVPINESKVFGAHQTVTIQPNTSIQMGEKGSIVFLGKVLFNGTSRQPITVTGHNGGRWGGVAIQGMETQGSQLSYVNFSDGSKFTHNLIQYPAMLNIHDTQNIVLNHCFFQNNAKNTDAFHTAYVENIDISDTQFTKVSQDAMDFEFSSGSLRNVRIQSVTDDGIDLMDSQIAIADTIISDCAGNGISSGEQSNVTLRDSLIANCSVGVLAKNAALINITSSLLYKNRIGARVYKRTVRYDGDSNIFADVLFVVGSDKAIKRDDDSKDALQLGRIQRRLPLDHTLNHLTQNVLGLSDLSTLDAFLQTSFISNPRFK